MSKYLKNLPSFVWIIIFLFGIIGLIGGIILVFTGIATVEGIGSLVILIVGLVIAWNSGGENIGSIGKASVILFFALMGLAIDQTGNFLYNKPIELIYCPPGTTLTREAIITNPLPGRTDINQDFNCVDHDKEFVAGVDVGSVLLVRFIEYVIIGYLLDFVRVVKHKFTKGRKPYQGNTDTDGLKV
jgi:hypothetical protein